MPRKPNTIEKIVEYNTKCPYNKQDGCSSACRYATPSKRNSHCALVAIEENNFEPMDLREIAEELEISHVMVYYVLQGALEKIKDKF